MADFHKRLTCSGVNGNQYMHGVALVLRKRSSRSRNGGSSSFLINFRPGERDVDCFRPIGDRFLRSRSADRRFSRSRLRLFSRSLSSRSESRGRRGSAFLPTSHSRTGRSAITCKQNSQFILSKMQTKNVFNHSLMTFLAYHQLLTITNGKRLPKNGNSMIIARIQKMSIVIWLEISTLNFVRKIFALTFSFSS